MRVVSYSFRRNCRMVSGRMFLVAAFLTGGALNAQQRPIANINVRVGHAGDESPIAQAEVRLHTFGSPSPAYRTYTDGGGRVTFMGVRADAYYLEVEKEGFEPHREQVEITGNDQTLLVRLRPKDTGAGGVGTGAATVSSGVLAAPAAARREYDKGMNALKENDAAGSIGHFRKAIEAHPQFGEAYVMLGLAHMQQKNVKDAMTALTKAIEINPKLRMGHTLLGKVFMEERDFPRAEQELQESMRLDVQAWDAPYELARCYFNMGKLDQALQYAQRAQSSPQASSSTRLLLADIYLRTGDSANALAQLEAFTREDPKSPFLPRVKAKIEQFKKK